VHPLTLTFKAIPGNLSELYDGDDGDDGAIPSPTTAPTTAPTTTTTYPTPSPAASAKSTLSPGAVVGIVMGALALVVIGVLVRKHMCGPKHTRAPTENRVYL
jgi:hypothetical protein